MALSRVGLSNRRPPMIARGMTAARRRRECNHEQVNAYSSGGMVRTQATMALRSSSVILLK
jgi:hypothetical protein